MGFKVSDTSRFGLVLRWMVRRDLAAMAIGGAMLLLSVVVGALPPHSTLLVVVFGLTASLVLAVAVLGRSRAKWLPLIVLIVGFWSSAATGPWVRLAVVQLAGHDESCQYVDSTEHQNRSKTGMTTTTTDWVVDCPDGRRTFSTAENVEVTVHDGAIAIRSAGSLFEAMPVGQAQDDALWFLAPPALAILFGSLITALRTPRLPTDTALAALFERRKADVTQADVTDHVPAAGDGDSDEVSAPGP
jgi:hypothetical protein